MSTVMMRCTGALAVSNAPCVSPASNRRSVATPASGGLSFPPLATRGARVARRHACVSRTRVDGRVRHTTRRDALTDGTRGVSSTTPSPDPNDGDENVVLLWKGPDGDVAVGSAAPGASVEISTYRGHEFAAKLHRHEEAFATYQIGAARRQTFRVRDPETQDL